MVKGRKVTLYENANSAKICHLSFDFSQMCWSIVLEKGITCYKFRGGRFRGQGHEETHFENPLYFIFSYFLCYFTMNFSKTLLVYPQHLVYQPYEFQVRTPNVKVTVRQNRKYSQC